MIWREEVVTKYNNLRVELIKIEGEKNKIHGKIHKGNKSMGGGLNTCN